MEKIDANENFIRLVDQYQNLVFSICLKLTGDYFAAEDLTQDTFVSVFREMSDQKQKMISEKAWLCRIASNKCIDYRKAAERRTVPVEAGELPERAGPQHEEPLQQVLNHEVLKELEIRCNALSLPYRDVALLHFRDGKTAKEISERSGVGLKTVQTQIYRAREMLKKSFGKEWADG